jgi:hypothetical protein
VNPFIERRFHRRSFKWLRRPEINMITYDKDYVATYRLRAITTREELVVGATYYNQGGAFTLTRLLTNRQSHAMSGLECEGSDADEVAWFSTDGTRTESLHDNNIGASYNPWLIFSDQATADEYYSNLTIGYD